MKKVLFLWEPQPDLRKKIIESLPNLDLHFVHPTDDVGSLEALDQFEAAVGWRPTLDMLKRMKNLELFINPGAGVQHLIPIFQKLDRNVVLLNSHGNAYATAQHAVALLLSLTNKIIDHHEGLKQGNWRLGDSFRKSVLLKGNLGLLGYGKVNQQVHQMLSGFDLTVYVHKRRPSDVGNANLCKNFHEFLEIVDFLIIALPLTPETEGLISTSEFNVMKPHLLLVNIGRGPVIHEGALYEALRSKKIAGAAIDTWYNYQPNEIDGKKYPYNAIDHPFHELENVILSPHRAASPMDDLSRWTEVIENLRKFSEGNKDYSNVVDLQAGY